MKTNNLKLFTYTVDEYKRFSYQQSKHELIDGYNEEEYIQVNIKLMLLRKYGTKNQNVYVCNIIQEAIEEYPEKKDKLEILLNEYNKIEAQQLEYVLQDGTKLNLYQTIEDVMYGMYLHADENRINRLNETDENLRFICVRKYVEELEKIILKLDQYLNEYIMIKKEKKENKKQSIVYLGNSKENQQKIKKSPYWSNLYGHDGNDKELEEIIEYSYGKEEFEIISKCLLFLQEIKKDNRCISLIDNLIFPSTKKDWGDYSEVKYYYKTIKNPGISSKVRYNENHTMAYVRIFPKVDECFIIDTPHIINNIYEISLAKDNEGKEWKIYSFGGHLEKYIV